jgi:tetratricopeptide (TPR) repeat protein
MTIQIDDPTILIRHAGALTHRDRYAEALEYLDMALKIDPTNKEAQLFRGTVLHALGRYPEAYRSYEEALGIPRQSFWEQLAQIAHNLIFSYRALRLDNSHGHDAY